MSRLRPIDRLLFAALVPLWVFAFAASMRVPDRPVALTPAWVAPATPDGHPIVTAMPPWAKGSPLRVGDRIVAIDGEDAAGAGRLAVLGRSWEARGADGRVAIEVERDGRRLYLDVALGEGPDKWPVLVGSLSFAMAAILALLRMPQLRVAQVAFPAGMAMALFLASYFGESRQAFSAAVCIRVLALTLLGPLNLRMLAHFPDAVHPVPWVRGWIWLFGVQGLLNLSLELGVPFPAETGLRIAPVTGMLQGLLGLGIFMRNYLVSDPIGRRKMRWLVLGVWIGNLPLLTVGMLGRFDLIGGAWFLPSHAGLAVIPGFMLIAVLRDDLWDVDRLLSATASVIVLAVGLVAGGIWFVPLAGEATSRWLGVPHEIAQIGVALATASVIVPLGWRLRAWLDRHTRAEARSRERSASALLRELSGYGEPRDLARALGRQLPRVFDAVGGAVYARSGGAWEPAFVEGAPSAPELGARTVTALAAADGPVADDGRSGGDAALWLPVRRDDELELVVALGPRRTGERYEPADRALLAAVSERASAELGRFAQASLLAQGREMVEALRTERDEALAANRAKSSFLAAASHDLRQPLHAVGLFAGALDDRVNDPEARELVDRLRVSVRAMEQMFDAALDASRLDAGVIEPRVEDFPLAPLLDRLHGELEPQARLRGLELRVVPTAAWVRSDPVLLGRILQNLAVNALRYTERGGVLIGARRRGADLRLEVWDTGRGIPAAQQSAMFQEYRRGRDERDREGLGLGLSIVRRLCALLDHPLALRSEPGRGSVFSLTVARAAPRAEAATAPAAASVGFGGARVLVIDDDVDVRAAMERLLTPWGCEVAGAAGCVDAVEQARTKPPDALLVDYRLADDETGVEAIEAVREALDRAIPALVVTGETAAAIHDELRAAGLLVLAKPAAPLQVRAALTHLLGSGGG